MSVDMVNLKIAMTRTLRAMTERRDPYDCLIDAVIAWESLFPDSRPLPVLPLACGHPGWDSGPWALPRASHPARQEPATHVTAGTSRVLASSHVPGISQTSSNEFTHNLGLRVATEVSPRTPSLPPPGPPGGCGPAARDHNKQRRHRQARTERGTGRAHRPKPQHRRDRH
jgi:hypothetical protein